MFCIGLYDEGLGLWIQFDCGQVPRLAVDLWVKQFRVILHSYPRYLDVSDIDLGWDYQQANEALLENNRGGLPSIRESFIIEATVTAPDAFKPPTPTLMA